MKFRAILGLLLVSAACAVLPLAAEAPTIWIDVPFVAQPRDGCGSAVISMVLQYWANKNGQSSPDFADPAKIQNALFSPALGGIAASSMQAYFQGFGYRTFAFRGEWVDLKHHLEQGRPLIVSLKASGPHGPLHYVVVVGIDSERGYLFVNDPAQQKMLRISRQGFESEWAPEHAWTLLVVPRTDN
ncbi:MAG: C39 family peptidase [Acidobacteriia bacterium]|nr:C39 family peptidase [Terriglobia bacterium]